MIRTSAVSVTTTPVKLHEVVDAAEENVTVFNNEASGGANLYAGGSDLSSANGMIIPPQAALSGKMVYPAELWVAAASGTIDVRLMVLEA